MRSVPRGARSSIGMACAGAFTLAAGATAQSPHPFDPPRAIPAFSLGGVGALLDFNRDASPDLVLPSVFFGTLIHALDEDGAALSVNVAGPAQFVPGASTIAAAIALASGDFDRDGQQDLVAVTSLGTVHVQRNHGSGQLTAGNFAADVVIDAFAPAFPIQPPLIGYWFPVATAIDLDDDGNEDIVVGGGPIDRWTGSTMPGFVAWYRGDGAGNFTVSRLVLPGTVVDVDFADLDGDAALDHIVVLGEQGSAGAFSQALQHVSFANGQLAASHPPLAVGPGRFTALAVADVVGQPAPDYLFAQTTASAGTLTAGAMWFEGDGVGGFAASSWGWLPLPPNTTGLQDYAPALAVADWNRDGHLDLAVLRGFVQPTAVASAASPAFADSELLVAMGPQLPFATFTSIQLPGAHSWSSTHNHLFPLLPLFAAPGYLRHVDLGQDASMDLAVLGMRPSGPSSMTVVATLRNTTPPQPGDPRFQKLGAPSGGLAARPARLGFDGGRPHPGNAGFGSTVQNLQGGCLVGLVWGPLGFVDLFVSHGVSAHLAPAICLPAGLAAGGSTHDGFYRVALPIPNVPALVGDAGWFQAVYYDHVAGVFGGTHATGVSIGL